MSACRRQAVIDAPVDVVWGLVGDPRRYSEYAADVVAVTGVPEVIQEGATFERESRLFGNATTTTTFVVDKLDELREIRMHCTKSGYYSHWLLTEAQDATFADVELGMDPEALSYRAFDALAGKRYYRRILDRTVDSLREMARDHRAAGSTPAQT